MFYAKSYSPYLPFWSSDTLCPTPRKTRDSNRNTAIVSSNPRRQHQGGPLFALEWIGLFYYHRHSFTVTMSPEIHIPHDHLGVLEPFHTIGYIDSQLEELQGHQKENAPPPSYLTEDPNDRYCSLLKFPNNSLQWDELSQFLPLSGWESPVDFIKVRISRTSTKSVDEWEQV